jgi:hypothetical protein
MDVARSKGVIILDHLAGRSANIFTGNDRATLDNMFRGCCAINLFTLMGMPFAHTREFRQGQVLVALDLNDERVSLIPEKIDYSALEDLLTQMT